MNRQQRRHGTTKPSGDATVKILVGVFALAIGAIILHMSSDDAKPPATVSAPSTAGPATPVPVFGGDVLTVASNFLCACGSCDVPELAECTCPTAVEEKEFIQSNLQSGRSQAEVIGLVAERYGHQKQTGSEPPTPVLPASDTPASSASGGDPFLQASVSDGVAGPADTERIASRFICACGQCTDHVLSECACDHPRGAGEMKAFIEYKISQKQLTVAEIVDAVAFEFGHLR